MALSPIEKLRNYAYKRGANIVDNGFCQWTCNNSPIVLAKIAAKALTLRMKFEYDNWSNTLEISY